MGGRDQTPSDIREPQMRKVSSMKTPSSSLTISRRTQQFSLYLYTYAPPSTHITPPSTPRSPHVHTSACTEPNALRVASRPGFSLWVWPQHRFGASGFPPAQGRAGPRAQSMHNPAGGHLTEGCIKPEIQPTFHSLSLMPGRRCQIHTEPPLGRGLMCHILESQLFPGGSPGLRLHGKEQSGPRPQLDKVWPLCPDLGGCVCLGGRAEARDVQEPEPGKSQAHACLWM